MNAIHHLKISILENQVLSSFVGQSPPVRTLLLSVLKMILVTPRGHAGDFRNDGLIMTLAGQQPVLVLPSKAFDFSFSKSQKNHGLLDHAIRSPPPPIDMRTHMASSAEGCMNNSNAPLQVRSAGEAVDDFLFDRHLPSPPSSAGDAVDQLLFAHWAGAPRLQAVEAEALEKFGGQWPPSLCQRCVN